MFERRFFLASTCALVLLVMNSGGVATAREQDRPEPPTGFHAELIHGNVVVFRWTEPANGAEPTDYVLEGGLNPGETLISLSMGHTVPIVQLMAPNGAFFVRAHTVAGETRSEASNEIQIFINQPVEPSAPIHLLASVSGPSVSLAWQNTFEGGSVDWLILEVSGSATGAVPIALGESVVFEGVPAGTYTVALRASNRFGTSDSSNEVTLTIPEPCSGVPEMPAEFLAYSVENTVYVSWESPLSGPAPIQYTLTVTGTYSGTLTTTDRTLSGLVPPGTYNVMVRADNMCGEGASAPLQTVVVH